MKQCIKYCMIAILAVLLHNGAIEAADFLCAPAGCKAESCILTQAPTAQQVIHNYYRHTSSAASCLEHVESQQVPNNKSSLLRTDVIRMQQLLRAQSYDRMPNVHCLTVPGPHYYIIGLRKIII